MYRYFDGKGALFEADVSTGNVYRYFDGKGALFEAVVPARLVRRFRALLEERLRAAEGAGDVRTLPAGHPYLAASDALVEFAVEHRLALVILLGGRGGTRWASLPDEVVDRLVRAVLRQSPALARQARESAGVAFDVEQVYRNFVAALVGILEHFDEPAEVREAIAAFERYHLAGLAGLLEPPR